jgi:hypothetical protein
MDQTMRPAGRPFLAASPDFPYFRFVSRRASKRGKFSLII